MIMKKCFKKRSVLVTSLVMLLMVVGYFNKQLTESAMLQSSKGYQKHEEIELTKLKDGEQSSVTTSSKNIEVVDSKEVKQEVKTAENKTDQNNTSYFAEQRVGRDKMRSETVERLNKIIEDDKTKEDVRADAQNELMYIGDSSEMELFIEGIVKGKGFKDVLVFLNKDNVRIVIDKEELTEQDVMKVLEIVTSETELEPQDIKIMKKQ